MGLIYDRCRVFCVPGLHRKLDKNSSSKQFHSAFRHSTESKNMDSPQDFLEKQAAQVKEVWSESHLVQHPDKMEPLSKTKCINQN